MSSVRKSTRPRGHSASASLHSSAKTRLDLCTYPKTGRRGAPQVFPRKLFQILDEVDENVISWTNKDGKSFIINDMDVFTERVLLNYFRHQKYSSFQRQLNLYGFHKICKGPETGAYAHDCFVRDQPELLMGVRRLPQRPSPATKPLVPLKQSHKLKISRPAPKKTSTFVRFSCLSKKQTKDESSDDSVESESEESDSESSLDAKPMNLNQFPVTNPTFCELEESLEESLSNDEADQALLFEFGESEVANLSLSNQDGIVNRQPIANDIVIAKPTSSMNQKGVVEISEAVNSMMIDKESPSVNIRKSVQFNEINRTWSVQKVAKPPSPQGLQWMIPVLGRAGSSAVGSKDDIKYLNEILVDKEEPLERTRFQSSSIDSMKDYGLPQPSSMNRLTSENWNVNLDAFADCPLEYVFGRQESSTIPAPQPIQMER